MRDYKTVLEPCSSEFVEKKSRFISYISYTQTEKEATDFIASILAQHRDCAHCVYAYSLLEGQIKRYSDAGEPSGTAGLPTLDVIVRKELFNVAIATVRYFGGILLGTGGLTRAYSKGASDVASASKIVTRTYGSVISLTLPYTLYGKINPFIISSGAVTLNSEFSENVDIKVFVPEKDIKPFCESLVDLANGKIEIKELNKQFFDM